LVENFKLITPSSVYLDRIAQGFSDIIVLVQDDDRRRKARDAIFFKVKRIANDELIAALTGTRRGSIDHTAAGTPLAKNNIGRKTRSRMLVPNFDELERQDPGCFAMIRIERDRAMIVEVGLGNADTMELATKDLTHVRIVPLKGRTVSPQGKKRPGFIPKGPRRAQTRFNVFLK
jgi:hypothetical protein